MKKLTLLLLTVMCIFCLNSIQANDTNDDTTYVQSSELAFYTVTKDTLFLDAGHKMSDGIQNLWTFKEYITEPIPVIVMLDTKTFREFLFTNKRSFAYL